MAGTLFIVATPIGNLGDITVRAAQTLKDVDLVACEDTRRTQILIHHLGLHKPLMRYDEHSHTYASRKILSHLEEGKSVALVTDAGTPGLSDPGSRLVNEAVKAGHPVVPIPGPSAIVTALSASGLGSDGFVFLGFLSRRKGRAQRALQEALGLGKSVVFFESPFRITTAIEWLEEVAPRAHVVLAREITKIHEEFLRGSISDMKNQLNKKTPQGEFVVIVQGERFDSSLDSGSDRVFRQGTDPASS